MTTTAVIQAKQGIGDVMWHLPFIRAIAATTAEGKVAFLAPPSTHAAELLQAEDRIAQTLYFEHGGAEWRRGVQTVRLAGMLRQHRFRTVWILDRTVRPALAAWLARIPERIGLGLGPQRLFITNSGIARGLFHNMPITWLKALLAVRNIPLASTEPALTLPAASIEGTGRRYAGRPRPWIVLGLGGSHPAKDWPDGHWRDFIGLLRRQTTGTVFLIGGAANSERAAQYIAGSAGAMAVNACALSVLEAAALLQHADLAVGGDSGPMNLATAVATPAFTLFGATPVLDHSRFIHAILPDDGRSQALDGMQRITPTAVMARIAPQLSSLPR